MRTIVSFANGGVTLTEDAGVFSLNINEGVSIGGGEAAGAIKVSGTGSVQLDAGLGLKLGEALINSHLPASAAGMAQAVESIVNTAVAALE